MDFKHIPIDIFEDGEYTIEIEYMKYEADCEQDYVIVRQNMAPLDRYWTGNRSEHIAIAIQKLEQLIADLQTAKSMFKERQDNNG